MKLNRDLKKEQTAEVKKRRKEFQSERSELISYCKILVEYFSYINTNKKDEKQEEFEAVEQLIIRFCGKHSLQVKAIKEVHFLCL